MSSKPQRNAFDVLMSGRSKKKTTEESSPKKRKNRESSTPNSLNPKLINPEIPDSNEAQEAISTETEAQYVAAEDLQNGNASGNDAPLAVAKKPRVSVTPDESISEVKKKAANFNPQKAAFWERGEKVPFMFVAKGLDAISEESGRIAITEIVCNMLRTVIETTPDDLVKVVYLLANKIAPAHEGLELGIGDASIIKALAEACGAKEAHIKSKYQVEMQNIPFFFFLNFAINKNNILKSALYVSL